MWKDKLKGLFKDACKELGDAYEDVKEKVEEAHIGEKIKKVGEDILDEVEKANIGEKLKQVGEELKAEFMPGNATTTANTTTSDVTVYESTQTEIAVIEEAPQKAPEEVAVFETAEEECALNVPAEDGERGEFTCLNEKTYSYLVPKNPGFSDEGDCHAAEIHQAYGYGEMVNYEYDAMICFSIAGEFDCEIKESGAKAAYTRYDSAPTRSKIMTVDHPVFTHAYLFETPKKYRITYLKQLGEHELLGCELVLRKSGGDEAWKAEMIEEFKRFAGSCREV